jgi:hypothetical protein
VSQIFLCYRRADSQYVAGRIYDRLAQAFSPSSLFLDVDSIPLSVPYSRFIERVLRHAEVVLVMIGPHWLSTDDGGQRRIDDPDDFVRIEIETALRVGTNAIPITLSGTPLPTASDLPPPIRALVSRQGHSVRPDPDFHRDMDRLVGLLRPLLGAEPLAEVASPAPDAASSLVSPARFLEVNKWNWIDGAEGKPVTKLAITSTDKIDLELVDGAFFGGGHRWSSEPTPEGSVLVMTLLSSNRKNTDAEYEAFFEKYNPGMLQAVGAEVEPLDGLDRAMWKVEVKCEAARPDTLRGAVEWILACHTEEIRRILSEL